MIGNFLEYSVIGLGFIVFGIALGSIPKSSMEYADVFGMITALSTILLAFYAKRALGEYQSQVRFSNAMKSAEKLFDTDVVSKIVDVNESIELIFRNLEDVVETDFSGKQEQIKFYFYNISRLTTDLVKSEKDLGEIRSDLLKVGSEVQNFANSVEPLFEEIKLSIHKAKFAFSNLHGFDLEREFHADRLKVLHDDYIKRFSKERDEIKVSFSEDKFNSVLGVRSYRDAFGSRVSLESCIDKPLKTFIRGE